MKNKNTQKSPLKFIVLGVTSGIAVCAALMLLSSFLIVKSGTVPQDYLYPITIFITALGSFIGGFVTGKSSGKNGLLIGGMSGLILFFITLIASFIVVRDSITFSTFTKMIIVVISGCLGGITGVNKN